MESKGRSLGLGMVTWVMLGIDASIGYVKVHWDVDALD